MPELSYATLRDYWQSPSAEIGPIMMHQTDGYRHIWRGCVEQRRVHYHLLLSTESTKKLMRRREGELPNLPFHFPISSLRLYLNTYNTNPAFTANGKSKKHPLRFMYAFIRGVFLVSCDDLNHISETLPTIHLYGFTIYTVYGSFYQLVQ